MVKNMISKTFSEYVVSKSREMSLEEGTVRELARSEPWDSFRE